jgi:hypothetical protein
LKSEEYVEAYMEMSDIAEQVGRIIDAGLIEILPGEQPGDAFLRYVKNLGLIEIVNDNISVNREKMQEFSPALLEFFDIMSAAEVQESLGNLEELGLVQSSVNDQGEMIYFLTEQGASLARTMNTWPEDENS